MRLSFFWLRGQDLTAWFAPLPCFLLAAPFGLLRTVAGWKVHRTSHSPATPSQVQICPAIQSKERKKHTEVCFFFLLVAGAGFEPTTFVLCARRATNCSTPRRLYYYMLATFVLCTSKVGAGDRGRTGTVCKDRRILSPVRLPIPPLRQIGSKGGARTHSLSGNSRVLHH